MVEVLVPGEAPQQRPVGSGVDIGLASVGDRRVLPRRRQEDVGVAVAVDVADRSQAAAEVAVRLRAGEVKVASTRATSVLSIGSLLVRVVALGNASRRLIPRNRAPWCR